MTNRYMVCFLVEAETMAKAEAAMEGLVRQRYRRVATHAMTDRWDESKLTTGGRP